MEISRSPFYVFDFDQHALVAIACRMTLTLIILTLQCCKLGERRRFDTQIVLC